MAMVAAVAALLADVAAWVDPPHLEPSVVGGVVAIVANRCRGRGRVLPVAA